MDDERLLEFCRKMPKVELHAHLNGSISPNTMEKLLKRHEEKLKPDGDSSSQGVPELWQTTVTKWDEKNKSAFNCFKIIHSVVVDEEAVYMVAQDVVQEFAADHVVYLELRSTPRANPTTGMTKRSYVDALLRGVSSGLAKCTSPCHVRLLLSIDRRQTIAEAWDTVQLAVEYSSASVASEHQCRVVGIDLSGDHGLTPGEKGVITSGARHSGPHPHGHIVGDISALVPVLRSAKENGLRLSLHIAEIPGRNEEIKLLLSTGPDRLGHGTHIHPAAGGTQELVDIVKQNRIPIEICLTSNVKGRTVASFKDHHLGFWKANDHHYLCESHQQIGNDSMMTCSLVSFRDLPAGKTDDKGVFATSLSEEYCIAAQTFSLTTDELWKMSLEAVGAVFEEEEFKSHLRKLWEH